MIPTILLLITLLLFISGLGLVAVPVVAFGGVVAIFILVLSLWSNQPLRLPATFGWYALFLGLFLTSIIWSQDRLQSLELFALYASASLLWLAGFLNQNRLSIILPKLIIFLGIAFAVITLINRAFDYRILPQITPRGVIGYNSFYKNHHHLGNWWALVLSITLSLWLKTRRPNYLVLSLVALVVIALSLSRSAVVTAFIGSLLLLDNKAWLHRYRRLFWPLIVLAIVLFLYASAGKTTIVSRVYYIQALIGLVRHPLGVGVGNFGSISTEVGRLYPFLRSFSLVTHNLILEFLIGMGLLGISFVGWFVKIILDITRTTTSDHRLVSALTLALAANFFFNSTYLIPAFVWLWFLLLGCSYQEKERLDHRAGYLILVGQALTIIVAAFVLVAAHR